MFDGYWDNYLLQSKVDHGAMYIRNVVDFDGATCGILCDILIGLQTEEPWGNSCA